MKLTSTKLDRVNAFNHTKHLIRDLYTTEELIKIKKFILETISERAEGKII